MAKRVSFHGRRALVVGAVTGALVIGTPMIPVASAGPASPSAVRTTSAAVGNVYGGVTSQGMPVMVRMTRDRREVVRTVAAMAMTCTAGGTWTLPSDLVDLSVTRGGRYREAFGPVTVRHDDGTTTDFTVRLAGALNDAKTKITGTWRLLAVDHDSAGAVTDTCDTGQVTWSARQ